MKPITTTQDAIVIREQIEPSAPSAPEEFCLHPEHSDRPAVRNHTQCLSCYNMVSAAIREGRASVEDLKRRGMIRQKIGIEEFWLVK